MQEIWIDYLNAIDTKALALTNDEILDAVSRRSDAQGRGETVIEPRASGAGKFRQGAFQRSPRLCRSRLIMPVSKWSAISSTTTSRAFLPKWPCSIFSTRAPACRRRSSTPLRSPICALALSPPSARAISPARTARCSAMSARAAPLYWNVRLLDHPLRFRGNPRAFPPAGKPRCLAARLEKDLGEKIIVTDNWEDCLKGADIMVEASRLPEPTPLFKTAWVKKGAFVVPYGTMSALEFDLTDIMDKVVVDDWGQCGPGRPYGALRRHVDEGKVTAETLHAEIGQIVSRRTAGP